MDADSKPGVGPAERSPRGTSQASESEAVACRSVSPSLLRQPQPTGPGDCQWLTRDLRRRRTRSTSMIQTRAGGASRGFSTARRWAWAAGRLSGRHVCWRLHEPRIARPMLSPVREWVPLSKQTLKAAGQTEQGKVRHCWWGVGSHRASQFSRRQSMPIRNAGTPTRMAACAAQQRHWHGSASDGGH